MKNILIACDLDNTLIHSYKQKRDGDMCIEWINGKEQSYINKETYEQIEELKMLARYTPLTTRSIEQYLRINWKPGAEPEYAVTTNGAILLSNNERVSSWDETSYKFMDEYRKDLDDILAMLESQKEDLHIRCRKVDEMYVFAYCEDGGSVEGIADTFSEKTRLRVEYFGRKIYFLPPQFNKGAALTRLKEKFVPEFVIAAGDSEIDITMLEIADLAYCKESIFDKVSNKNKKSFTNETDLINSILGDVRQFSEVGL